MNMDAVKKGWFELGENVKIHTNDDVIIAGFIANENDESYMIRTDTKTIEVKFDNIRSIHVISVTDMVVLWNHLKKVYY